jgi:hypothetical protein
MKQYILNNKQGYAEAAHSKPAQAKPEAEQTKAGYWLLNAGLAGWLVWSLLMVGLNLLNWLEIELAWTLILGVGLFLALPVVLVALCLVITANQPKTRREE